MMLIHESHAFELRVETKSEGCHPRSALPVDSSTGRALHQYHRGQGLNPVQAFFVTT